MDEKPPYKYPRLAFVGYCLQRWTVHLAWDALPFYWRRRLWLFWHMNHKVLNLTGEWWHCSCGSEFYGGRHG